MYVCLIWTKKLVLLYIISNFQILKLGPWQSPSERNWVTRPWKVLKKFFKKWNLFLKTQFDWKLFKNQKSSGKKVQILILSKSNFNKILAYNDPRSANNEKKLLFLNRISHNRHWWLSWDMLLIFSFKQVDCAFFGVIT